MSDVVVSSSKTAGHALYLSDTKFAKSKASNVAVNILEKSSKHTSPPSLGKRIVRWVKAAAHWLKSIILIILGWFRKKPNASRISTPLAPAITAPAKRADPISLRPVQPKPYVALPISIPKPISRPDSPATLRPAKNTVRSVGKVIPAKKASQACSALQPRMVDSAQKTVELSPAPTPKPAAGTQQQLVPYAPGPNATSKSPALRLPLQGSADPVLFIDHMKRKYLNGPAKEPAQPPEQALAPVPAQTVNKNSAALSATLQSPCFHLTLDGKKAFLIDNPFSSPIKPSDERIYQLKVHLKRALAEAGEHTSLKVINGEGKASDLMLSNGGVLTLTGSDEPAGEAAVAKQKPLFHVLLEQAAAQYPEESAESITLESSAEHFPLPPGATPSIESGRNLLLNVVDGFATVWDQHPLVLGQAIQYCVELSESGIPLSIKQKEEVRTFFTKLRSKLEPADFAFYLKDRSALQRILSPRLDTLMSQPEPNRELQLEIDLAKGELAASFDYGIISAAGGKNGAVFIKTFEDRPVGVFKAPKNLGYFDWIEKAKQYFGQARLLSDQPMAQEYAEVVASDLCKELDFSKMAPESIMAEFGGEKGAYIAFLDGYKELAKVRTDFEKKTEYTHSEIYKWQMMTVWNFLLGNLDPHDENIFVIFKDGVLEDIRMIDHGNSFPMSNPGWLGSKGNLGAWGTFSISKIDFLPEVRQFIQKRISPQAIQSFFDGTEDRSKFFTQTMRKLQLDRARVLAECVATGKISNPTTLAAIKTNYDYKKYLTSGYSCGQESHHHSDHPVSKSLIVGK